MHNFLLASLFSLLVLPFLFLSFSASQASAAIATSNCVVTDVGKPPANFPLPPGCESFIAGSAPDLARQILANKKITLNPEARRDLQSVVNGKPITFCSRSYPGRFEPATIHPALLKTVAVLGQKHSFSIWNFVTGHACDQYLHPHGKSMDIGSADGKGAWQNQSFRQDAADALPDGGEILQQGCPGTPNFVHHHYIIEGTDSCTHQHIDVGWIIKDAYL